MLFFCWAKTVPVHCTGFLDLLLDLACHIHSLFSVRDDQRIHRVYSIGFRLSSTHALHVVRRQQLLFWACLQSLPFRKALVVNICQRFWCTGDSDLAVYLFWSLSWEMLCMPGKLKDIHNFSQSIFCLLVKEFESLCRYLWEMILSAWSCLLSKC